MKIAKQNRGNLMNITSIEWVQNPDGSQGYTLNSKTGCKNHTSEGLCLGGLFPCYAYRLARGRLKKRYLKNNMVVKTGFETLGFKDPFYPRFWPERLKQPYQNKKPVGIFLDDMSDWMGDYWPEEWTKQELQMMRENPWHRFYTLTKQPQNLIKFSPFPDNCWVGITATNDIMFRIASNYLAKVKAKVKYYSFEPLLHWDFKANWDRNNICLIDRFRDVNWIIIGACTGLNKDIELLSAKYPDLWEKILYNNKRALFPKVEWVEELVEAADKAGIPVFLKDNLELLFEPYFEGGYPWAYRRGSLRQEMPDANKN